MVGLIAAGLRSKLRLWLRSARRVGKTVPIRAVLRRAGVGAPLLRGRSAGIAAFSRLRSGAWAVEARRKGVAIVRSAIGGGLLPAGLLADAVVVGLPRATLGGAEICGALMVAAMALELARLRAGVAGWAGLPVTAFAARRAIASRFAVVVRPVAVGFAIMFPVHFRAAFTLRFTAAIGAEIGAAALAVRPRGFAAGAGIGRPRRPLIAITFAGFTTLGAARLALAGTTEFIDADLAVAVAIELPEQVGGAIHFLVIDDAVAISIERAEKSGHGALWAVAAFGAGSAFTRRGVRRAGWRSVFLSGQRPRGQRESEGGDKEMPGFHDGWVLG